MSEQTQVNDTDVPIMFTVQVSDIAANYHLAKITKTTTKTLSVTPTLSETLNKM